MRQHTRCVVAIAGLAAALVAAGPCAAQSQPEPAPAGSREPAAPALPSIGELRAMINGQMAGPRAPIVLFQVREVRVPRADAARGEGDAADDANESGVPVRAYQPRDADGLPVVILIHGGGFIAGSIDTHDAMARTIALGADAVVVSIGYSLAPEARFPTQIHECEAVLDWVLSGALDETIDVDPSRLAVVGDSAGGNLAAVLALRSRDRADAIDFQGLVNPVVDASGSMVRDPGTQMFTRLVVDAYMPPDVDRTDPDASPISAGDLSRLPPAMVLIGESDPWRPEQEAFVRRLAEAGNKVNQYVQWGAGHLGPDGARATPAAKESLDVLSAALRAALHGAGMTPTDAQ
jgi:acetyl esterase